MVGLADVFGYETACQIIRECLFLGVSDLNYMTYSPYSIFHYGRVDVVLCYRFVFYLFFGKVSCIFREETVLLIFGELPTS